MLKAYKNFFRDKSIGFPKFKSKKTNYYSYTNKLSKVISEVAWSEFITMLEYKADWYGRTIVVAPTNYASSQLCSECGYKNIFYFHLFFSIHMNYMGKFLQFG